MWGINGPALDRWITGNYGEDQFSGYEDMCEECLDEQEEDWVCPYDYDGAKCFDERAADEKRQYDDFEEIWKTDG